MYGGIGVEELVLTGLHEDFSDKGRVNNLMIPMN